MVSACIAHRLFITINNSANMQKTWALESLDGLNEETKSTLELCLTGMRFVDLINIVGC